MKVLDRALYAKLKNDGTLTSLAPGGVFDTNVPPVAQGGPAPGVARVIFQQVGEAPGYTYDSAIERARYIVKGMTHGHTKAPGQAISARIYGLLQDGTLTLDAPWVLVYMRKLDEIEYVEFVSGDDVPYWHIGMTYEMEVQAT